MFDAELALLRRKGRDVRTLVVDNASIPERGGPRTLLRVGLATVWSSSGARLVTRRLATEPADIVHIHNTFPLLSPAIHVAARNAGAAVVQTIHNYRPICPAATLFRDGAVCHDCVGRRVAWPSVVHGCYQDSRIRTIPVASMLAMQRIRRSWDAVHAIIALTEFAAAELVAGGLPADRIHVKANFVESGPADPAYALGDAFLYIGRLVPEKGIDTLLAAADLVPRDVSIRVAGDGPSASALAGHGSIVALGQIDAAAVRTELAGARALVFPSRWYEGMPIVILEAFAAGVPVIAARIGAAAEMVRDGETGLTFEPDAAEDLARAIAWAHEHPDEMAAFGRNARLAYEATYTPEASYDRLVNIHAAALTRARSGLGRSPETVAPSGRPA